MLSALERRRQKYAALRVPVRLINHGSKVEVCRDGDCLDISEAAWLLSLRTGDLNCLLKSSVHTFDISTTIETSPDQPKSSARTASRKRVL
jgi:hypothetical protein